MFMTLYIPIFITQSLLKKTSLKLGREKEPEREQQKKTIWNDLHSSGILNTEFHAGEVKGIPTVTSRQKSLETEQIFWLNLDIYNTY